MDIPYVEYIQNSKDSLKCSYVLAYKADSSDYPTSPDRTKAHHQQHADQGEGIKHHTIGRHYKMTRSAYQGCAGLVVHFMSISMGVIVTYTSYPECCRPQNCGLDGIPPRVVNR